MLALALAVPFLSASSATIAGQHIVRDRVVDRPMPSAPVVWVSQVNVVVVGDMLRKNGGCDGCPDAGAASAQSIASGDAYVEFIATDADQLRFVGLSAGDSGTTGEEIDFALRLGSRTVAVSENGVTHAVTGLQAGDVLRVQISNGKVRYLRNGKSFYTSRLKPAYPLIVDAALYSAAAAISRATIGGQTTAPPPPPPEPPPGIVVRTSAELRAAMSAAIPGTIISIAPGIYPGGIFFSGLTGTADAPVIIQAADPASPPLFVGGFNGIQLSDARHVTFRDLVFEGAEQNGINIDDAGTYDTPSHHIVLTRVTVRNLPSGNRDGIKLSGVTDFVVEDSLVAMWGDGGSGIDLVGCHRGIIRRSLFRHTPGMQFGNGVQAKGGSTQITITGNRFEYAAARAVQIGGTTGLSLFRPQPHDSAEAREILVEYNEIVGGEAAIAFVGSDGGVFRYNTIYLPTKWPIRILQENTDPSMVRCRNGVFTANIVYWRGRQVVKIGSNPDAGTFTFARNWWYREDSPADSQLALPSPETAGVYGLDPRFIAAPTDFRTHGALPYGAHATSASVAPPLREPMRDIRAKGVQGRR